MAGLRAEAWGLPVLTRRKVPVKQEAGGVGWEGGLAWRRTAGLSASSLGAERRGSVHMGRQARWSGTQAVRRGRAGLEGLSGQTLWPVPFQW